MSTYHNKTLYVNSANTSLITSSGAKADQPVFHYKDQIQITWYIQDSTKAAVDLSGGSFEFKIASGYNTTPMVTVTNASFTAIDLTNGTMSCIVDMDNAAVLAFIDEIQQDTSYAALWVTISGVDYCLASFTVMVKNLIF